MASLSTLYNRLYAKQEQLQRLTAIVPDLDQAYSDYAVNLKNSMEPALTSKTWAGKIAKSFDDAREAEIQTNYQTIISQQFPLLFAVLDNKIVELQNDIDSLYDAISRAEAEAEERRQREREKSR
ncbi:DUF5082 family protein [Metabacillus schmidteae]|uniref:DUF5082 family protein n=1 Tax=Metabacillus schmidteae TaxID=2730405 RepID=UPI0015899430|nr:DUF5082 family protein [Metabacillus schmidteae]